MIVSGLWSALGFNPYVGFLFSHLLFTGGSRDLSSPALLVHSAPCPRESSAHSPQHLGQGLETHTVLDQLFVERTRGVWLAILGYESTPGAG